jgi:hypothetical protein
MKVSQYMRAEQAIVSADGSGIRSRWLYGLRLLRDPEAMSAGGGGLRHGVAEQLVAAAKARGLRLSDREIRRRLQCARVYSTETQIGHAVADFETWRDLSTAGFPPVDAPPGEPPADHRTKDEKDHAAARRLLDLVGEQGTLFPLEMFEPTESPLKDLVDYATEQEALTARFVEHGRKRREYLDLLVDAVGGDLAVVWEDAHKLAFGDDEIEPAS